MSVNDSGVRVGLVAAASNVMPGIVVQAEQPLEVKGRPRVGSRRMRLLWLACQLIRSMT